MCVHVEGQRRERAEDPPSLTCLMGASRTILPGAQHLSLIDEEQDKVCSSTAGAEELRFFFFKTEHFRDRQNPILRISLYLPFIFIKDLFSP